ncbi:hypothetical protein [Leptospira kmetyi]|uniref:hypothetical protein n=1 Tax=Leptospira kmetyi TaxID=408139 RepID=UPI0014384606|nr:hypothetical protein [Leptospira kmetyi]
MGSGSLKTFDIILLIFGYTLFWTFLIWFLMGIGAACLWYCLKGYWNFEKDEDRRS